MFVVVALLFAIVNGVVAEKPSGAMKHKQTFESSEACESYLKENGEHDNKLIVEMAASHDVTIQVKLLCVAEKTPDNSI